MTEVELKSMAHIPMSEYESMKDEIKYLKSQISDKTIYRDRWYPPIENAFWLAVPLIIAATFFWHVLMFSV